MIGGRDVVFIPAFLVYVFLHIITILPLTQGVVKDELGRRRKKQKDELGQFEGGVMQGGGGKPSRDMSLLQCLPSIAGAA